MTLARYEFGFRVVGHPAEKRRPVNWHNAFFGYADCDPAAQLDREAYLSHFTFGQDFVDHLNRERSEKGYNGPCGASWLFWDIDRPGDLALALRDARRLAGVTLERYRELDDDDLLVFLSGGKGVHVGIPTTWHPEPSPDFHAVARLFCLSLAEGAGVAVDASVYSKTRLFRAPNSRHPRTGVFKRRLALDVLTHLKPEAVIDLARHPEPFEIPKGPSPFASAAEDWGKARQALTRQAERRPAPGNGDGRLTAFLRRFIREGELEQDRRAVSTFRAAAELAEYHAAHGFDALAHALLTEAALDSGLPPSEVKRQIDCGLDHGRRQREGGEHV
jgi:hypothetical protein